MSTNDSPDFSDAAVLTGLTDADHEFEIPFKSPVKPVQLSLDDTIQFRCHKDIACFNKCCKSIEIQLTPYDIVRLKKHMTLESREFVARYTIPFEMDAHSMPGLRLTSKPGTTECIFLEEDGCSVYEDRPTACRYYALGSMGVRKKEGKQVDDIYFVVKEPHCLGHEEPRQLTVREYREEQGFEKYDEMNAEWRDIIIKKRSSGPTVGMPSTRSMQLFDMCSYDLDSFRDFIQGSGFTDIFDLDSDTINTLIKDDDALLQFAMRFLKQVLYGERTIPFKKGAREKRYNERQEITQARHQADVNAHRAKDPLENAMDD